MICSCIDCDWCYGEMNIYDATIEVRYYCQRGTVMKEIEDPEKQHDCPDFKQFIDDL